MDIASLVGPALQALPFPLFIVDPDVRILATNERGAQLIGSNAGTVLQKRGGEALHCIRASDSPDGCGHGPSCADCVVRNSVNAAFAGHAVVHARSKMELRRGDQVHDVFMLVSVSTFSADGQTRAVLIVEDLSEVLASANFLPVCMGCKRVRQEGKWQALEQYLGATMDLKVTHSLCPVCMVQMYPDFAHDAPRE